MGQHVDNPFAPPEPDYLPIVIQNAGSGIQVSAVVRPKHVLMHAPDALVLLFPVAISMTQMFLVLPALWRVGRFGKLAIAVVCLLALGFWFQRVLDAIGTMGGVTVLIDCRRDGLSWVEQNIWRTRVVHWRAERIAQVRVVHCFGVRWLQISRRFDRLGPSAFRGAREEDLERVAASFRQILGLR
jgi:hypothetical protein